MIPKAIRDALGLEAGYSVEIMLRDGAIVVAPELARVRLVGQGKSVVAVADPPLAPMTAEKVRDLLERTRR